MFEDVPGVGVVAQVRAHAFDPRPLEAGHERIEAIIALDRTIRQAQAEQAVQVATMYRERDAIMSLGDPDAGLSVAGEVAMARNIGPSAAGHHLALALGLERLPRVFDLFKAGLIPEAVARAVVRETDALDVCDLEIADAEIAELLPGLTTIRAGRAAAKIVIELDADAAHERAIKKRADARVEMRPDPDGVAELWVRGPAEKITAAYQALDAWAVGLRSTGDPRTRGQIMVDTLVERVTGLASADTIDVEIQLVMDADTLLGDGSTAVELTGYGPIAPSVADDLIASARNATVRRLLTDPVDGTLAVRETRRRRYNGPQRGHIRARDQYCRQPGCECGIRDGDHIRDVQHGGPTSLLNGQGLCKRSHITKHLPGWHVRSDGKATLWTTPTGHTYRSDPPPLLGHLRQ